MGSTLCSRTPTRGDLLLWLEAQGEGSQQQCLAGPGLTEGGVGLNCEPQTGVQSWALRGLLVPQGSKFAVTVCNCTFAQKISFLSVSQPRLLRVGDCLPGAWRDSVLYGVCSGSCQREGRALSDQGPGPLVRFRLREGRRWCQGSPMQTPCSWPVTRADVSPSSRVSQLRAPQGLPCPISLFPVPGSSPQD